MERRTCHLKVSGNAAAKGSMRAFVSNGRVVLTSTAGAKLKRYESAIRGAALESWDGIPTREPVKIALRFYLRRPKNQTTATGRKSSKWRMYNTCTPDIDKLTRAVLDALTKVVYVDDSQVIGLDIEKGYVDSTAEDVTLVDIYELKQRHGRDL